MGGQVAGKAGGVGFGIDGPCHAAVGVDFGDNGVVGYAGCRKGCGSGCCQDFINGLHGSVDLQPGLSVRRRTVCGPWFYDNVRDVPAARG